MSRVTAFPSTALPVGAGKFRQAAAPGRHHSARRLSTLTIPVISRRNALFGSLPLIAAGGARAYALDSQVPLKALAQQKGLLCGTCARGTSLASNPVYAATADREYDLIVSALEMQWRAVSPSPDQTEFARGDAILAWAERHKIKLLGHGLVWYSETPPWFAELPAGDAAVAAMQSHVRAMCEHFAGRMRSWVVVNEALRRVPTARRAMWDSVLFKKIGPDFVEIAFRAAREADAKPTLLYNDYAVELNLPNQRIKQAFLVRFIDDLRRKGVPVDAVGIQSHLRLETMQYFDEKNFSGFLRDLAGTGVTIVLTELDVADRGAPADIIQRDAEVASAYRRYLDVALDNRSVTSVVTWGFTDSDSWIVRGDMPEFIRGDGAKPRPLLFDGDYRPKPAYYAVADALRAAPARGP